MVAVNIPIAQPEIDAEERQGVLDVLDSGHLASGPRVSAFEESFAEYCDVEHAIATSNGTTALHAALEAIDLRVGAYVVTTPFSFVATANAIRFAGGFPLFVDIDPETFNITPDAVEEAIVNADGAVDAILVAHLFGLPAEMDGFQDIADDYGVALIEDAAQAHGARYRDQPVGSFGDAGCFSFYPTKNMTTGEGGMITTNDEDIAYAARSFIDHGRGDSTYAHESLGHNFRMTDLAAAIGSAQLEKLPRFIERRRDHAAYLTEGLAERAIVPPVEPVDCHHAYHQYTIRTQHRDEIRDELAQHDIDTAVYYPTPIPDLRSYQQFEADIPIARSIADEVLSLPVHPGVTTAGLDRILECLHNVPKRGIRQ